MPTMLENAQRMIAGELPPPPIASLIGFRVTEIEPGRARVEMKADVRHTNPMGTLHGGIFSIIADTAMGMAYAATLEEGESFATLELKINFLRPIRASTLVAEGVVVQRGRSVGLTECSVFDSEGRLVARASSTCMTLRGDPSTLRPAQGLPEQSRGTTGSGSS